MHAFILFNPLLGNVDSFVFAERHCMANDAHLAFFMQDVASHTPISQVRASAADLHNDVNKAQCAHADHARALSACR